MRHYNNVVKICFLKKDAFGKKYVYELNIKENKELIMDTSMSEVNNYDENFIKLKGNRLYNLVKKWDSRYIDKKILDGVEYTFVVEFDDGEIFNVYCKNKFPEDVDKFMKIIGEVQYE